MSNSIRLSDKQILRGKIKCKYCNKESLLLKWDLTTKNRCITREQRRAYVSLEYTKAYKGKYVYECPKCHKISEGKLLNVITAD